LVLIAPPGPPASGPGAVGDAPPHLASERLPRLADRLREIEIDAVIAAGAPGAIECARTLGAGRSVRFEVEPALDVPGGIDGMEAFIRIIARELGHTAAVVAEPALLQCFIAHVVGAGPDSWDRFGIEPATLTLVEVGDDGRGILAMLNGAARLDELTSGRLRRATGGAAR
jgi:broad specificity phosphatase PhoE